MQRLKTQLKNLDDLNTVCLAAFNQRRKTIRNSFKKLISVEQLSSLAIDANLRPENLSIDEFITLANFITDNPPATEEKLKKSKRHMATKQEKDQEPK